MLHNKILIYDGAAENSNFTSINFKEAFSSESA